MEKINLLYSTAQTQKLKEAIMASWLCVLNHGEFISGPEVKALEQEISSYLNVKNAISCGNGTDALTIALMAIDLKPGEIVFTPSFTFVATAESICLIGGRPYFVDIDPKSYNICIKSLERALETAVRANLKVKAILSVDLFGNPAPYDELRAVANKYGVYLISDAAQSFGATYHNKKIGSLADITTTSFFPTKPLGCYGDGGMIFTDNEQLAQKTRSICLHGKGDNKYHNIMIGMNSRLDTIQAVVLLEKLKFFDEELQNRNNLAQFYHDALNKFIKCPTAQPGTTSSWAIYTLQHPKRDLILQELEKVGIPSNVYYKIPLHKQPAYEDCNKADVLKASEQVSKEVFCLPMHAYINQAEREYIVNNVANIITRIENA